MTNTNWGLDTSVNSYYPFHRWSLFGCISSSISNQRLSLFYGVKNPFLFPRRNTMNTQERFLSVMNFEKADRTLYWEMGYWKDTIERWYQEGLPKKKDFTVGLKPGE